MKQRLKKIKRVKYDMELVQRDSITFWISEDTLANWFDIGMGSGFQRVYWFLEVVKF